VRHNIGSGVNPIIVRQNIGFGCEPDRDDEFDPCVNSFYIRDIATYLIFYVFLQLTVVFLDCCYYLCVMFNG
jgi:hypothetical protein